MKIAIIHNFYGASSPSGENKVVETEADLLRDHGHQVKLISVQSDNYEKYLFLKYIIAFFSIPWKFKNTPILAEIQKFKPDIIHVHNTFPFISPSIFWQLPKHLPVVITLHNYRLVCPSAIPMRNGAVCTKCIDTKNPFWGVFHKCYRNSALATVPLALKVWLHNILGTWTRVNRIVCLTQFHKNMLVNYGYDEAQIVVKPNFFEGSGSQLDLSSRKETFVFVGRLSEEKGVVDLIKRWKGSRSCGVDQLVIVGSGPELPVLTREARDANIKIIGNLEFDKVCEVIAEAKALFVPSKWFEGFPLVIREAYAHGTPIICRDIGPLKSLTQDVGAGLCINFDNQREFDQALNKIRKDWCDFSKASYLEYQKKYTKIRGYKELMSLYREAGVKNDTKLY